MIRRNSQDRPGYCGRIGISLQRLKNLGPTDEGLEQIGLESERRVGIRQSFLMAPHGKKRRGPVAIGHRKAVIQLDRPRAALHSLLEEAKVTENIASIGVSGGILRLDR